VAGECGGGDAHGGRGDGRRRTEDLVPLLPGLERTGGGDGRKREQE